MKVEKTAEGVIMVIIMFVVVTLIVSALAATLLAAFGNIAASGLPLAATLFTPSGIVLTVFVLALFIGLVYLAFTMFKKSYR